MTAIEIKNIEVQFPIYDARARSFRHRLLGIGAGRIGATETHHVVVHALRDITLSLNHGDRLGLQWLFFAVHSEEDAPADICGI